MPRTNEVSFWTNIQTQGHKSARVRKVIHCGESHWLLASVLREQDRTISLAREFWSSLENVSENLSLMLSGQQFKFKPDVQWQKFHWLSRSLACPVSHFKVNSSVWLSDFKREVRLSTTVTPLSGLLEATGNRKHVLLRLISHLQRDLTSFLSI